MLKWAYRVAEYRLAAREKVVHLRVSKEVEQELGLEAYRFESVIKGLIQYFVGVKVAFWLIVLLL